MAPVTKYVLALCAIMPGLVGGAVPVVKTGKPAICGTTLVADYQGLSAPLVSAPTDPVNDYKELSYSNLFLTRVSGALDEDPATVIFYSGATNAIGQPSISTLATSFITSFDLLSLDIACPILGIGYNSVNGPCRVSVVFYKANGEQESRDCFNNNGPTGGLAVKFVTCKLAGLTNLKKVVFETSATSEALVSTLFDNLTYKVNC